MQNQEREKIKTLFEKLESQPQIEFPQSCPLNVPTEHGVYVIRDPQGTVFHVGRTLRGVQGLFQRLTNHLKANSSFVRVFLKGNGSCLRNGYTFQYLVVKETRDRALLEHYATAWHCPKHLGVGKERSGVTVT
jgi:excinuclease UvrABC nuclease subunit